MGQLLQAEQIKAVIFFREEAHRAVVAALDDVLGNAGERNTGHDSAEQKPKAKIIWPCSQKTWSPKLLVLQFDALV